MLKKELYGKSFLIPIITINSIISRSLESRGKIDPPTDIERHPMGPTPAGEESPLPHSGRRSSRILVHVETWQSYIGGGGGAQAGANGDRQG